MSDKLIAPQPSPLKKDRSAITNKILKGNPTEGTISATIGTGENAKNSIIWVTIRWSFILGALISIGLYLRPTYCNTDYSGSLIEDIKATWSIFLPIITLALGYTFGKGR